MTDVGSTGVHSKCRLRDARSEKQREYTSTDSHGYVDGTIVGRGTWSSELGVMPST